MASCVSLSPVISKAPIITSSPLKKPHYASKIALLEQLQRRHRNYKIKRQLASETTSTIKIEGREEILDSIDNFSSYTLDMESADEVALHIVEKTKTRMKNYYKKRSKVPAALLANTEHRNMATNSSNQFKSPNNTKKRRVLLPPINSQETITTPPQSIEYLRRYKEVHKKRHHDKIQQSPYYNKSAEKHVLTILNRANSTSLENTSGHHDNNISVNNSIASLTSATSQKTATTSCKRKLSFSTDHVENQITVMQPGKPANDNKSTRDSELSCDKTMIGRADHIPIVRRKKNDKRTSLKESKGTPLKDVDNMQRIATDEAKVRRERITLKANQRAQIYALNAIMRDLEESNFSEEMSSKY